MNRGLLGYAIITLKGMAMGAADVVPGVSGGTIAFIAGIYEELIKTIDQLDLKLFSFWKKHGFRETVAKYNLKFLGALFLGILVSILSLAQLITFLLEEHPILVWSFFFGLVVASVIYIGKQIERWSLGVLLMIGIGILVSYYITIAEPVSSPDSWWYILGSGFIAIIAMILPGVSGSFILLLLGSYLVIIGALTQLTDGLLELNMDKLKDSLIKILLFALGAVLGLKVFSRILNWMFTHKKNLTLAVLTGFMVGSLNKIWPWKEVLTTRINSEGLEVPLLERSILPSDYKGDPQLIYAIVMAILGVGILLLLERLAKQKDVY
ncbi:DUF368 domain-containing protein [Croceiramulus getboli]|nr:DUF368 domain-containing protein [Flavobacteriaceae bacterium YJPT1-3]